MGIEQYQKELNKKLKILEFLIEKYNDGKSKNFYCIAVNLLGLADLENIMKNIDKELETQNSDKMAKIILIVELLESCAKKNGIELKLRKA